jgi:hypothetical protein
MSLRERTIEMYEELDKMTTLCGTVSFSARMPLLFHEDEKQLRADQCDLISPFCYSSNFYIFLTFRSCAKNIDGFSEI